MKRVLQAMVLLLGAGFACSHTPLTFDISGTSGATWIEIGAYKGAACSALTPMLSGGIPTGYARRYAFKKDDPAPPSFGDIPNDTYAFAAVARNDKCGVIAAGCSNVDVGSADGISISLGGLEAPVGECGPGASCQAATCVPANDNSDPSVGANCSLQLLGSGPLAASSGIEGTQVSAPAIAPTKDGFLIVYHELDGTGSQARLVVLPIDASGGALRPQRPGLEGRCLASKETDGVGLAVNDNDAVAVFTKFPCPGSAHPEASLQLVNIQVRSSEDATKPSVGKLFDSPAVDPNAPVTLGAARPSTSKKSGNIVVFTQGGIGNIANVDPASGVKGPNGQFGEPGLTGAWVTANDRVLALLSAGPGDPGTTPIDDPDGGADGGTVIGSSSDSTLRLLMLKPDTDIQTIKTTTTREITFPGSFGSIASVGGRVIVVTGTEGLGRSVTYHAYDFGKAEEQDSSGFAVDQPTSTSKSKVSSVDVTILDNRAFMAGLQTGQVTLQVYDSATTQLTPLRNVNFSRETRISGINTVRDGSVAVAASQSRVAVVWTTAKELGMNDAAGGYAVFACTQ